MSVQTVELQYNGINSIRALELLVLLVAFGFRGLERANIAHGNYSYH